MPTVLRFYGLRVVLYPNDHRPAHVHVVGRGREAVFELNCSVGPVELRENYGFSRREIRHILRVLTDHLDELICSDTVTDHTRSGDSGWSRAPSKVTLKEQCKTGLWPLAG